MGVRADGTRIANGYLTTLKFSKSSLKPLSHDNIGRNTLLAAPKFNVPIWIPTVGHGYRNN